MDSVLDGVLRKGSGLTYFVRHVGGVPGRVDDPIDHRRLLALERFNVGVGHGSPPSDVRFLRPMPLADRATVPAHACTLSTSCGRSIPSFFM